MDLNYNFIFLFAHQDYHYSIIGKELYHHPQVRVHDYAFDSPRWMQKLFHYHTAYSLNKRIDFPFKSIWFKRMYNQGFDNDLPLCFIYVGGNMVRYDGGFTKYVHRMDPRNRVAIMHQDLISKKIQYDYNIIRNKVDLAVTYDEAEARQYGIHYFPENVYSKLIPDGKDEDIEQDVYFLGAAKDRLPKILAVYHKLMENGVSCKFQIAGVAPQDQEQGKGLEYIKNISYEENLRNVTKSRCVLELIQGGSNNITLRAREAIAYQRRLLTDCPTCAPENYNPGQMQYFDDPEDIDISFIKAPFSSADYPPQIDLNPMKRLYDIQEQLEKQNHAE